MANTFVRIFIVASIIILAYLIFIYSNIGFIKTLRNLYIETAMSTMTHQWLATAFIPNSVINEVMNENTYITVNDIDKSLIKLNSSEDIKEIYSEINFKTISEEKLAKKQIIQGEEISKVKTVYGDEVYAIDTINDIVIVNIEGRRYKGKMAIIKDPSKVRLAISNSTDIGETVLDIADNNNGILAINASGFYNEDAEDSGGNSVGLVKSNNIEYNSALDGYWFKIGFDSDNILRIGKRVDTEILRDGVQFKPPLIINGKVVVEGSNGWGIQPRTVIGQTYKGEVVFLVIDGRQLRYSLGITVGECAKILYNYGVVNAINLDGGSSSTMVYNGEIINSPCTENNAGRNVPNAWIISGA